MGQSINRFGKIAARYLAVSAIALILAACGGGGGGSSASTPSEVPSQPPAQPPVQTNLPPVISGTPATSIVAGQAYSFQPSASDPNGDTLTFAISSKPAWATFNTSTGRLSGTPASTNIGSYTGIVISVSDGTASVSLPAFSIQVQAIPQTNLPPVISGAPNTSVVAGQAYSFRPSASDPNNDSLTFSVSNRPAWAAFNTSTGRLNGTPGAADVGSYTGIVIRVSDGTATVSLAAFAITVTQVTYGSATMSWIPPTENTDGSQLTDLAGYRIYYGTSASSLDQVVELTNPGLTSYVVENLSPATWYFAMRSFSADGTESEPSGIASKTIL